MEEDKTHYKLGNTIQEFEELFGNVPINDINKIKKYLLENYIPKSLVKEKIEELENKKEIEDNQTYNFKEVMEAIIAGLQDLLREE